MENDETEPTEVETVTPPWAGEFPRDRAGDMDPAAIAILIENMRAGRAS